MVKIVNIEKKTSEIKRFFHYVFFKRKKQTNKDRNNNMKQWELLNLITDTVIVQVEPD